MDEMYGINSNGTDDYTDRGFMSNSDNNLMLNPAVDINYIQYYNSMISSAADHNPVVFGSEELGFQCSVVSESASNINNNAQNQKEGDEENEQASSVIKAKIASHPSYPKLLDAYINCQKVGAPPEIACLLDEIRREKDFCKREDALPMCLGVDPELDEFMETYYEILVKYKSDLSRPFDEATSFLNNIETQLGNLCKDDGSISSDEELTGGDTETQTRSEDRELKERLFRMYGSHITSLKLEFSKKKKKGKLPKEARQTLLEWWNVHHKWPYPTEADKFSLAELTGLDQKQINNWFINQRKRHWKPSENMQLAIMDNLSGHFFADD